MAYILTEEYVADYRARLCEAAETLLAEGGQEAVGMRALAARLGVSPMTPYRYFDNKQALISALRVRAFERLAKALQAADAASAVGPANAVAETYVAFASEHPAAYRLMFELAPAGPQADPALVSAIDRARTAMSRNAKRTLGGACSPAEDRFAGDLCLAMLHGLLALEMTREPTHAVDSERLRSAAGRALTVISRGLSSVQQQSG